MAEKQPIPLGGNDQDYNSVRSRTGVLNMLGEADESGQYRTVKDGFGLTPFATTPGAGRSDLFVNSGFMYAICGQQLIRVDQYGTVEDLGTVGGGSSRGQVFSNAVPGDNQIMVLNGIGEGFVYTNGAGLQQVTDPDFLSAVRGDVIDERGWFARRQTNEIFGSDVGNLLSYQADEFYAAEQNPDDVVAVVAKKSALWILGEESCEYFQTTRDVNDPLRPVKGASKERGISAVHSLAEAGERFCWFADDNTVRMIEGNTMDKISDLDLELLIRGDGTDNFPGFAVTNDAIGFFIDGPVHKLYYLTFPTEGYTWGYDFSTGLSHRRASEGLDYWRVGGAALFNNKLYGIDIVDGFIYELDQGAKDENGEIMRRQIVCPSISAPFNWTLPYVELEMEVGQSPDPTLDPRLIVEYSKDGGYTYTTWGTTRLGKTGDYLKRVVMRNFGKVNRHKNLILRFSVTDPVRIQLYKLWAVIEQDV